MDDRNSRNLAGNGNARDAGPPGPSLSEAADAVDASGTRGYLASADLPRTDLAPGNEARDDPPTTLAWSPEPGQHCPGGFVAPATGPLGDETTVLSRRARPAGRGPAIRRLHAGREAGPGAAGDRLEGLGPGPQAAGRPEDPQRHRGRRPRRRRAAPQGGRAVRQAEHPGDHQGLSRSARSATTSSSPCSWSTASASTRSIDQRRRWLRSESPVDLHMLAVKAEPDYIRGAMAAALSAWPARCTRPHAEGVIHRDVKPANILLDRKYADRRLPRRLRPGHRPERPAHDGPRLRARHAHLHAAGEARPRPQAPDRRGPRRRLLAGRDRLRGVHHPPPVHRARRGPPEPARPVPRQARPAPPPRRGPEAAPRPGRDPPHLAGPQPRPALSDRRVLRRRPGPLHRRRAPAVPPAGPPPRAWRTFRKHRRIGTSLGP